MDSRLDPTARATTRAVAAAALAAALAALALPSGASGVALPCLLTEANRINTFAVNLDADRAKERIQVYNFDAAETPVTMFQVCDLRAGEYVLAQRRVVTESPGNRDSGLRAAWVGDLDRRGRVEIAIRDHISPSAGEVLSIFRQRTRTARTFRPVQTIAGDQVTLTRRAGAPATITAVLRANHARDGRAHTERWTFRRATGMWACAVDCGGR
jgi:hypothetical protein